MLYSEEKITENKNNPKKLLQTLGMPSKWKRNLEYY